MVFPTAGSDQPRSPGYRAEQRPPGTAQGCDQSTPCLQTTAEPNLAQRKGLRWGAADLAPGSRLCQSSTSTSRRVVRAEPQPPAGGAGHTGPSRGAGAASTGIRECGTAGVPGGSSRRGSCRAGPGLPKPPSPARGTSVPTLSRINLLGRVESALFLLYMQIISLNNLTANIFWFLTPCPGQRQAVFPADPLASFATSALDYFDFTEARDAYEWRG